MRINTKTIINLCAGDLVIHRESFEYDGPVAEAISAGASGSGNKSKSQSQNTSQQTSESGTKFNEDFFNKALAYVSNPKAARSRQVAELPALEAEYADIVSRGFKETQTPYANDLARRIKEARDLQSQGDTEINTPTYDPKYERATFTPGAFTDAQYTPGAYTAGKFTSVAPEGFDRLEKTAYEGQQSKIARAYNDTVARQREELAQSGALNSQAQYLPGSARSTLDKGYLDSLQQAARDAFGQRFAAEEREAGRRTSFDVGEAGARTAYDVGEGRAKTAFDVGEAGRRTGFDVGEADRQTGYSEREAGRETAFNQDVQTKLLEYFLKQLALAIDSGRYSQGQGTGSGESSSSSIGGSGSANASFFKFS